MWSVIFGLKWSSVRWRSILFRKVTVLQRICITRWKLTRWIRRVAVVYWCIVFFLFSTRSSVRTDSLIRRFCLLLLCWFKFLVNKMFKCQIYVLVGLDLNFFFLIKSLVKICVYVYLFKFFFKIYKNNFWKYVYYIKKDNVY